MTAEAVWRITAASDTPGWLEIPTPRGAAPDQAWVDEQAATLQAAWASRGVAAHGDAVTALLHAALAHRRDDDALAFQLWPTTAPLCLFVHVAVGLADPGGDPGPGDGMLYESAGLGSGVFSPLFDVVEGAEVVGAQFLFTGFVHGAHERVVRVDVEPTLIELLTPVMPSVHAMVQSLRLTGPDGQEVRARPPGLLEAAPEAQWVDTLTSS